MRKWVIGAFVAGLALAGGYAAAQIVPALPFQLQNNTVADATQVMANFDQLLNSINTNGAKNGANSDITSLLGLTTPLAPSVGGTTVYTGGTSTGSANAQIVATVVPSTFSLVLGSRVVFVAGNTNTDLTTLNVAGSGAKSVYRVTSNAAVVPAAGGEFLIGAVIEVIYNGTNYQVVAPPIEVGAVGYTISTFAPVGSVLADGSCVAQVGKYATLFNIAGTSWGSCAAGQFALPDLRGRGPIGRDMGVGRVTSAGSGCDGATLATGCGAQNHAILQAEFPAVNFNLSISDTRTWATSNALLPAGGATAPGAGGITGAATATQPVVVTGGTIGGTAASGGAGTPITLIQPGLVLNPTVKY